MACRFTLTQRVLPQGVKFPYTFGTFGRPIIEVLRTLQRQQSGLFVVQTFWNIRQAGSPCHCSSHQTAQESEPTKDEWIPLPLMPKDLEAVVRAAEMQNTEPRLSYNKTAKTEWNLYKHEKSKQEVKPNRIHSSILSLT